MHCVSKSVFGLLLSAFLFMGNTFLAAQAKDQHCTPSFPLVQDWLGADVAYSIPLKDGRDVWIFGDTLYGEKRQVVGDDPIMVRNSIGISTCIAGKWKIDYFIRRDKQGNRLDFMRPQRKDTWYWPLDGVEYNNELWIATLCMRNAPKTTAAALGFETCGMDLAHVTGLKGKPQTWKVTYLPVVPDGTKAYPSASTIIEGNYLYIFALDEIGKRPGILTRIPLRELSEPKKNLQYLHADGTWQPGIEPAKAKPVMEPGASEMSVRFHPELKKWVAVMVEPVLFSDKILFRTAPDLTGPWTPGEIIYRIPELQKNSPGYDPDNNCYAGKEHPQFEKSGELVFTYVCNTMKPPKLTTNLNIYFPRLVRMKMPRVNSNRGTE